MVKAKIVCFEFEPGTAGWKVQMNPLSYGGPPDFSFFSKSYFYYTQFPDSVGFEPTTFSLCWASNIDIVAMAVVGFEFVLQSS